MKPTLYFHVLETRLLMLFYTWYVLILITLCSHYASALEACRASRLRLTNMELTVEEGDLLSRPPSNGNEVKVRIEVLLIDMQKSEKRPEWLEKTRNFFHGFCKVIDKTSALVQPMLPQSAEYTVTFGLLVLLFRVCVRRKSDPVAPRPAAENIDTPGCRNQK